MMIFFVILIIFSTCCDSWLQQSKLNYNFSLKSGKTPLVANGKRFEADAGSSLMDVCKKFISLMILNNFYI